MYKPDFDSHFRNALKAGKNTEELLDLQPVTDMTQECLAALKREVVDPSATGSTAPPTATSSPATVAATYTFEACLNDFAAENDPDLRLPSFKEMAKNIVRAGVTLVVEPGSSTALADTLKDSVVENLVPAVLRNHEIATWYMVMCGRVTCTRTAHDAGAVLT